MQSAHAAHFEIIRRTSRLCDTIENGWYRAPRAGHTIETLACESVRFGLDTAVAFVFDRLGELVDEHEFPGCMRSYAEETRVHDTNAAFFTMFLLITVALQYPEVLSSAERAHICSLAARTRPWFLHECEEPSLHYQNKTISDGATLLSVGMLLEDSQAQDVARSFLHRWINYTQQLLQEAAFHNGGEFVPSIRSYHSSGRPTQTSPIYSRSAHPESGLDSVLADAEELERAVARLCPGAPITFVHSGERASIRFVPADPAHALQHTGAADAVTFTTDLNGAVVVSASSAPLLVHASFLLVRAMQREQAPLGPGTRVAPPVRWLVISQWDNLDGTIEGGYALRSLFDWIDPEHLADRQNDSARLLEAVEINTVVLNNVNAVPGVLAPDQLQAACRFAERFCRWEVRAARSVNFAAPVVLDGLPTADPFDTGVRSWWSATAEHLYHLVPAPETNTSEDSVRDSYETSAPLNLSFTDSGVLVIKNGPLDFQVREPLHPLFGRMLATRQAVELQNTQECTGQDVHLCFLPNQWGHYLERRITRADTPIPSQPAGTVEPSNTFAAPGVTADASLGAAPSGGLPRLSDLVTGVVNRDGFSALFGVSAWGQSTCWSGHRLAQANLYGFTRLAWDPATSACEIARDVARQTTTSDRQTSDAFAHNLMRSWTAYEEYTSSLGLGMPHDRATRLRPAPGGRANVRRADRSGTGRDCTAATGTGFAWLYPRTIRDTREPPSRTDERLLFLFHRVSWDHRLSSRLKVRDALRSSYNHGVTTLVAMIRDWNALRERIDSEVHTYVAGWVLVQLEHANEWRATMLEFFARYWTLDDDDIGTTNPVGSR